LNGHTCLQAKMSGLPKLLAMTKTYPTACVANNDVGLRSDGEKAQPDGQTNKWLTTAGNQPTKQVAKMRKVTRAARIF
jgi:hypothetical protein